LVRRKTSLEGSICCPSRTSCNHFKATKLLVILLDFGKIKEALLAEWLLQTADRSEPENEALLRIADRATLSVHNDELQAYKHSVRGCQIFDGDLQSGFLKPILYRL
jgi:hypothetical protein